MPMWSTFRAIFPSLHFSPWSAQPRPRNPPWSNSPLSIGKISPSRFSKPTSVSSSRKIVFPSWRGILSPDDNYRKHIYSSIRRINRQRRGPVASNHIDMQQRISYIVYIKEEYWSKTFDVGRICLKGGRSPTGRSHPRLHGCDRAVVFLTSRNEVRWLRLKPYTSHILRTFLFERYCLPLRKDIRWKICPGQNKNGSKR